MTFEITYYHALAGLTDVARVKAADAPAARERFLAGCVQPEEITIKQVLNLNDQHRAAMDDARYWRGH